MGIVKMSKIELIGFKQDKTKILATLHDQGVAEIKEVVCKDTITNSLPQDLYKQKQADLEYRIAGLKFLLNFFVTSLVRL